MIFWHNNNSEHRRGALSCEPFLSGQPDQRPLHMHREHSVCSRLCHSESGRRMKNFLISKVQEVKVGSEISALLSKKKSSFLKCKIYDSVVYLIRNTCNLIICILQNYKYGVNIRLCLGLFSSSKAEFGI